MTVHQVSIHWQRDSADFRYDTYNRKHRWEFGSGSSWPASAAPEFFGNGKHTDPEEAFVASVSACHMLSFLAICARKRISVDQYRDQAAGYLEKNAEGRLCIVRVELAPEIVFTESAPGSTALAKLHALAHRECFIANSIKTEVVLSRHA